MPDRPSPRSADPYRDLSVIDARAPRFNQAVVGLLSLAAVLAGAWPLLGLVALQLGLGLWLGRRFCLPCVAYFELVQPLLGEGPLEDSRPPRFANQVGVVFTGAGALAGAAGMPLLSAALGGIVAALALLSAATGFCTGCALYRLAARLRGLRPGTPLRVDLADLGVAPGRGAVVQFTHPLCAECHELERRLLQAGQAPVLVDVTRRPDLARRYRVASVPLAVRVDGAGAVLERLAG
ncbi:MAG TPA: DUF4395 family protein [Anaeromyxobacter sp.]|nr:DUF4395 family protein [Anaeromyxobacter sp.]